MFFTNIFLYDIKGKYAWPIGLSLAAMTLAALLMIMHWPYDEYLYLAGVIGINVTYIIRFFNLREKPVAEIAKLVFILLAFPIPLLFHIPGNWIWVISAIVLLAYGVWYFSADIPADSNKVTMLNWFLTAIVVIGAMFKILHWPGANIMLVIGIGGIAATFILHIVLALRETKNPEQ